MKKLIPAVLVLLILICSCSTKKSFLHQRYTHYKHSKTTPVTDNRSYAKKSTKATVTVPEVAVNSSVTGLATPVNSEQVKPVSSDKMVYTKSIINKVVFPVANKGKEIATNLFTSNSKHTVAQPVKIKPLNVNQKQEKRGLLWGVIDGILAIIVLAVFVALVIWLVLVLSA